MTEVFIITVWFWEGDSNIVQEYVDVTLNHDDAIKCVSDIFTFDEIKKVVDCDDSFDAYEEDGEYGSPSIVEIVKKTFDDLGKSDDKVDANIIKMKLLII